MTKTIIKTITAISILSTLSFGHSSCEEGSSIAVSGIVQVAETTDGKALLCGIAFVSGMTLDVTSLTTAQKIAVAHGLKYHKGYFSKYRQVKVIGGRK